MLIGSPAYRILGFWLARFLGLMLGRIHVCHLRWGASLPPPRDVNIRGIANQRRTDRTGVR